jgi:glutathione-specific gamma-glutamylcyclotransferase
VKKPIQLTRDLVDLIPASIPDPGVGALEASLTTDNYHQRTADEVMENLPENGELWVFAFGSLIWKPRFSHDQRRVARVTGWQRSFCLGPDTRYRGSPDLPGYMLSLVEGGSCEGVVLRMAREVAKTELLAMIETEPPIPPVWLEAETAQGQVRCIAFVCPQEAFEFLGDPSPEDKIKSLSTAVGKLGSMPDYIYNTVRSLEEAGIHDPYLWQTQQQVAAYLETLNSRD